MSDDTQRMSDDTQPPRADARTPDDDGVADAVPGVGLVKPDRPADPWAPPADDAGGGGPGGTLASNGPAPWPAPSVHDQQTVTSLPDVGGQPPPWASPGGGAGASAGGTNSPYAPGAATVPPGAGNPFAVPGAAVPPGAGNPFAAPAPSYAGQEQAAVPPPPIAPDGPGQVPYGYPGGPVHPGQGGYGVPQPYGYYGWPGMGPMPSNGMGTAGLVLGIVGAIVFCLWPLAIVLGILGVIFGAVGRGKARTGEATNPGQALAGIICGAAGIVLGMGFGVLVIVT
ncbi:DUF4190 domain-containing protein [Streptomyces sp. NPDC032940]|uniref:DUF4190 domain-containing protein n=1 Tax=Streptomyces sp. NPDC032940 TaxID=3155366 RepID=UPI00340FC274